MNLEELEEAMDEILPVGFSIETNSHGQIIIYTGLRQDDDGELITFDREEEDNVDPDLEPIGGDDDLIDD